MTEIRKTFHYFILVSFSSEHFLTLLIHFHFIRFVCLIYFCFSYRYTYAIILLTNKIWENKRCFVLQRFIRGHIISFSKIILYEHNFFRKCYIYKHMLFIQTRLKYIFVRFLFQWPPGDVILSKNHNCIVVNNQNWPTARSILIYRKLSMHRFYFFGHIQL